ncbi:hypothetical protein [Flavobacterium psychrophilum]|uniref:hypothetical protein n=1 Tax=Flavobacterium psychrophilum TaxID=96345 RepID=UPI0018873323|nr:hypothetical protein [Flavobacterium psychrophilum]MBF2024362.1 hypothetical protein [Flavobacterium psychrophilum]MCB5983186.1 hypothetical protein [Flavobacterium psychrophilum]MCB5995432.1 hypothetical protein [Flavobacterium psychrophilum]MCB5997770.1 hypothetical protein [Flavobacterium psychrophilum]MCB6005351.1 hypothetical protein [Flavobacterium psychrophilum]
MLVQPNELITELYPEIVNEITRNNSDEVLLQLKSAEDFIKSYLFKYDLKALFGTPTQAPTFIDESLKKCVKIVASYWLVRKANPNVNLEVFADDFSLMIGTNKEPGWLIDVKNGNINPDWPYKPDDITTPDFDESEAVNPVFWASNYKRTQRF